MKEAEKQAKEKLNIYKEKIIFLKEPSSNAIKKIKGKVDFVYMDIFGIEKDEKKIRKELESYYNILKNKGIIGGDDINIGNVALSNAVSKFAYEKKMDLFIENRDWWCMKKDKNE